MGRNHRAHSSQRWHDFAETGTPPTAARSRASARENFLSFRRPYPGCDPAEPESGYHRQKTSPTPHFTAVSRTVPWGMTEDCLFLENRRTPREKSTVLQRGTPTPCADRENRRLGPAGVPRPLILPCLPSPLPLPDLMVSRPLPAHPHPALAQSERQKNRHVANDPASGKIRPEKDGERRHFSP